MEVPCPLCKKKVEFKDNPYRPFCSERCQLIDLGEWALEKRAVPADHTPRDEDDSPKKTSTPEED